MGRGNIRKLDWKVVMASVDTVLGKLSVDEIWLEDLLVQVIEEYVKCGHRVIMNNHYPVKRFHHAIRSSILLTKGWQTKTRARSLLIEVDGVNTIFRKKKRKAFRIGEGE